MRQLYHRANAERDWGLNILILISRTNGEAMYNAFLKLYAFVPACRSVLVREASIGGRGSKPEARILSESPMETTTG